MPKEELFYVGTFDTGFYLISLDGASAQVALQKKIESDACPAYMTTRRNVLYIANENSAATGGISTYTIGIREEPKKICFFSSDTPGPAHIAVVRADDGIYVVGAGYFDGRVQIWKTNDIGTISGCLDTVQHEGTGPYHDGEWISEQNQARAHCILSLNDKGYFVCTDLGCDTLFVYRIDHGKLRAVKRTGMWPGSGPRHIIPSGCENAFYLINELDSTVDVLKMDNDYGFDVQQRISTVPDSFRKASYASAIHMSNDGRWLYAANRGYDSIVRFRIHRETGKLDDPIWAAEGIETPRDFCFDQSGKYVITANLSTDSVALHRIDAADGSLHFQSRLEGIRKPACILSAGVPRVN